MHSLPDLDQEPQDLASVGIELSQISAVHTARTATENLTWRMAAESAPSVSYAGTVRNPPNG